MPCISYYIPVQTAHHHTRDPVLPAGWPAAAALSVCRLHYGLSAARHGNCPGPLHRSGQNGRSLLWRTVFPAVGKYPPHDVCPPLQSDGPAGLQRASYRFRLNQFPSLILSVAPGAVKCPLLMENGRYYPGIPLISSSCMFVARLRQGAITVTGRTGTANLQDFYGNCIYGK